MKTQLQCLPCFIRQATEGVVVASQDPDIQKDIMRQVLTLVSEMDLNDSPPAIGQQIHRLVRRISGHPDPYREVKKRCNELAQSLLPDLRARLARSHDPLETALRLALAGNVIDFGVTPDFSLDTVAPMIDQALKAPLDRQTLEAFRQSLPKASTILYLADNTGEIFLDRLLIEQLPLDKVVLAVRGGPILNDAQREDAELAGLTDIVKVIDNGSDAPGTLLDRCSDVFQATFNQADLIIAKGQGNFETLHDQEANIYFILKAKCPVAAGLAKVSLGSWVFINDHITQTN